MCATMYLYQGCDVFGYLLYSIHKWFSSEWSPYVSTMQDSFWQSPLVESW